MKRKTFNGFIYDIKKEHGDKRAYIYKPISKLEKENYEKYVIKSHNDMYYDILILQRFFKEQEIDKKKIAILGKNSYYWFLSLATTLTTDNIVVPLDKDLQENELLSSLTRAEVDIFIYDTYFKEKVLKTAKELNIKTCSFVELEEYIYNNFTSLENNKKEELKTKLEKDDLLNIEQKEKIAEEYEKNNPFSELIKKPKNFEKDVLSLEGVKAIVFTSGTTAMSKMVLIKGTGLLKDVQATNAHEHISPNDTEISLIPYHHIFGLACSLVMREKGACTAYSDGLKYLAQNFKEYEITVFVGVPLLLKAIYDKIKKAAKEKKKWAILKITIGFSNFLRKVLGIDIRRKLFKQLLEPLGGKLSQVITAASAIDVETYKFFDNIGVTIIQGYGLTETSPVVSAENFKNRRLKSIGIPLDIVEVDIDKEALINYYKEQLDMNNPKSSERIKEAQNGIEGEIIVRGENITPGYYKDLERTKAAFKGDSYWFRTGDIGYMKDGFLFITGRIKDMIVLPNGKKAFPEEIEFLINSIDGVDESFVFGIDKNIGFGGKDGETKMYVKIKYDEDFFKDKDEKEIHQILWDAVKEKNKLLPRYKYLRGLILTKEEFEKTSTKKIKRNIEKDKIEKELVIENK